MVILRIACNTAQIEVKMELKLTVIIPVFNGAPFIQGLIEQILSSGFKDLEILVGNDGSTDETQSVLERIQDPRVQVFSFSENRGAGAVRNVLLDAARGEYIAMQDADDSFHPKRFIQQIQFLDSHSDLDGVGTWASMEAGGVTWGHLHPSQQPSRLDWFFKRSLVHASIMFRKNLLRSKARYHESLYFGEDYYFLLQLYLQGAKFENLEEELYVYKISRADLKGRSSKHFKRLLKMEWVLSSLFPPGLRWIYLGLNSFKLTLSLAKGLVDFTKARQ